MGESTADSSFGKGLAVLGRVIDHDGVRADELAAELGLPLSSVYRYLRTLRERGFVREGDGRFSAGSRLRHQVAGLPANRVADLAGPFLEHLARLSEESAVLTVRHRLHGVCVRQVESRHQLRLVLNVGQLLPLYAGASSRVLLAFAPEHVQRGVLAGDFRFFTPNTPTRNELRRIISRVRTERFAISKGELMTGAVSLAVPVLKGAEAVCAIGVAGPQSRCEGEWQDQVRRELDRAAESLREALAVPERGVSTA